ncbi:WapI family immunity protein [Paenibacillus gallinarum]|uniref:Uncharacterized protein n=1 Tax=Paenibacillus gallinarum TaxID=2762232 RepID=A0ABR8T0I2_9BACL|nr:hypothetical protein [Paenibacillus gallinarum]MBD7969273.1 hypothetical protein [Paenibacillus gallinarum]
MNGFRIYGENNQHLSIQLNKMHEFPDSICYSGGYNAEGSIIIKSGSYSASGSLWISTGEILMFRNQLEEIYDNCCGVAKLASSEVDFEMSITIESRGRVVIEGTYKEYPAIDNELMFYFESDQMTIGCSFTFQSDRDNFE